MVDRTQQRSGAKASDRYTSPAGWSAQVPAGWHAVPFETADGQATSQGVQISNSTLPPPSIKAGYPIQVNGKDLPDDGIALIIATDDDPSDVQQPTPPLAQPPVDLDQFTFGSAPAGSPTLALLWFSANGQTYIATVKSGPDVTREDEQAVRSTLASLQSN